MNALIVSPETFISVAYNFHHKPSEKTLGVLQRQLQLLNALNDLSIFDPNCMKSLQFFSCLEVLLHQEETNSQLVMKIVAFLTRICHISGIRLALRDDINILPALGRILLSAWPVVEKSSKILQLMELISYGVKLTRLEAWVVKVVPHLVKVVIESEDGNNMLRPALTTLLNMCRFNPIVLERLKKIRCNKELVMKISVLKLTEVHFQLLCSESLFYFIDNNSTLDKVDEHVASVLDLICCTTATLALKNGDADLLRLSSDILCEYLSRASLFNVVKSCRHIPQLVEELINHSLLKKSESSDEIIGLRLDILKSIVELRLESVEKFYDNIFLMAVNCVQKEFGVSALSLISSVVDAKGDSVVTQNLDLFVATIKKLLDIEDMNTMSQTMTQKVNASLSLLETLSQTNPALCLNLSMNLPPTIFTSLLHVVLANINGLSLGFDGEETVLDGSGSSTPKSNTIVNAADLTNSAKSCQRSSVSSIYQMSVHGRLEEASTEAVIRILTLIKFFSSHAKSFYEEFLQMLSNPSVILSITYCEHSLNPVLVEHAVLTISDKNFRPEIINALVRAKIEGNSLLHNKLHSNDNLNGFTVIDSSNNMEDVLKSIQSCRADERDPLVSDLIDMYECKLASTTEENNTILNALESSDEQNQNTRRLLMKAQAENRTIRGVIKGWSVKQKESEEKLANYKDSITEVQEKARKERMEGLQMCEDMKRKLASGKQDVEKLHLLLKESQDQNTTAQKETARLEKALQLAEDERKQLSETNAKLEEIVKKNQRELENIRKQIDKQTEQICKQRNEKLTMEKVNQDLEQTIAKKDNEIEKTSHEVKELQRIRDMIYSISKAPSTGT